MNVGGGGSNEGRVSSLERPPPPPHSHSVAHNVGNLLHMAGLFYSSCVNQYDHFLYVVQSKITKKKICYVERFLCTISFLLNNNHAFLFFTPQNGCKVRLSMLLFPLILFIRTIPWNTFNLIQSRIVCGLILSCIFTNMKKFNIWLYLTV